MSSQLKLFIITLIIIINVVIFICIRFNKILFWNTMMYLHCVYPILSGYCFYFLHSKCLDYYSWSKKEGMKARNWYIDGSVKIMQQKFSTTRMHTRQRVIIKITGWASSSRIQIASHHPFISKKSTIYQFINAPSYLKQFLPSKPAFSSSLIKMKERNLTMQPYNCNCLWFF